MVWIKHEILFILGVLPLLVQNAHHERRPIQNFGQFFPGVNSVGGSRPTRPPTTMSRPPPPPITGRPLTANSRPPMMSRPPPITGRPLTTNLRPPIISQPPLTTDRPLPSNSQLLTRPQSPMTKPKSKPPTSSAPRRPQTNSQRFCRSNRVPGPLVRNGGKSYWFSWRAFRGQRNPIEPQKSWEEARKTCQKYCMDLVTIESQSEDKMISDTLVKSKVYGIWTGGQICQETTCMENNSKSTWVWKPTNLVISHNRYVNWSKNGAKGISQPDNFTKQEGCLAILNNWYKDGVAWHDLECKDKLPFVCER